METLQNPSFVKKVLDRSKTNSLYQYLLTLLPILFLCAFRPMNERLGGQVDMMTIRKSTVEHPFGTIKHWMGATHFQMKTIKKVSTEMSLHVLAYNLKRVMKIMGTVPLMEAMRA